MEAHIKISPESHISRRIVVRGVIFGLLLCIPTIVSLLIIYIVSIEFNTQGSVYIIFFLACFNIFYAGLVLYCHPVVMANPYVKFHVKRNIQQDQSEQQNIISQVAFTPRIQQSPIWTFLEDVDDFGYMTITRESIEYKGIHVEFKLPATTIKKIITKNPGNHGLWMAGKRITLETDALEGIEKIHFNERTSYTIPQSRRISREMLVQISEAMPNPLDSEQ